MIGAISGFFDGISKVTKFAVRWDDDLFDRINHRYSTVILLIFTVIVSTKQYVGEPIICWCPSFFTGAMVEYTHQLCWISNTYYLPPGTAPLSQSQPRERVLVYYQWVPFILLAQAFLFQVTNILWIILSGRNGVDVNRLVMMVAASENVNPEIRDKTITAVVQNMDETIAFSYWTGSGDRPCHNLWVSFKRFLCSAICDTGNYLTACYIICKIIYIANTVGQLYLLNYLLGAEGMGVHFSMYGIYVAKLIAEGKDVGENTRIFPRVTMCDFSIRQFSNQQPYTIECALPINLFSEKFFIFLWFWIVFVFFANICSFLIWIWCIFSTNRVAYVKKYLKLVAKAERSEYNRMHIPCFADKYLRQDGVFCLRMLATNTNDVLVAQIVAKMWSHYKQYHMHTKEYHKRHREEEDLESGPLIPSDKPSAPQPYKRRMRPPVPPKPPCVEEKISAQTEL